MSKLTKISALGAAALTAAMPMMALAEGATSGESSYTDNLSITIDKVCTIARATTAHAAGSDTGTWDNSTDTLSKTLTAGTAALDLGSSTFHINCNNTTGYEVTMDAEGLTSGSDSISYIETATAPTVAKSEWAVKVGSNYKLDGDVVNTSTTPLTNAGTDFTVIYGVTVQDGQAAGTYTGTVTYTLAQL